jgi:23S rRNA-/tRNA-specific pseudouridylate synthase
VTHHQVATGIETAGKAFLAGCELIEVLEGMEIGSADPAGERLHEHFSGTRLGCGNLVCDHLSVTHDGCTHLNPCLVFLVSLRSYRIPGPRVRGKPIQSISILYRDNNLAVINKPADVSLLADRSGTPCLWEVLPDLLGSKPYLVHRLDKPTSGVLAIALNADTQRSLTRAFAARQPRKFYLVRVLGDPGVRGIIDLPLRKGRKSRYRVAGQRADIVRHGQRWTLDVPAEGGHPSLTRFRRLDNTGGSSLLLLMPRTGRTHQLRVHLSWIGHPILGESLYGNPKDPTQRAERLCLHAHRLVLPGFGSFQAPLDEDWCGGEPARET